MFQLFYRLEHSVHVLSVFLFDNCCSIIASFALVPCSLCSQGYLRWTISTHEQVSAKTPHTRTFQKKIEVAYKAVVKKIHLNTQIRQSSWGFCSQFSLESSQTPKRTLLSDALECSDEPNSVSTQRNRTRLVAALQRSREKWPFWGLTSSLKRAAAKSRVNLMGV